MLFRHSSIGAVEIPPYLTTNISSLTSSWPCKLYTHERVTLVPPPLTDRPHFPLFFTSANPNMLGIGFLFARPPPFSILGTP